MPKVSEIKNLPHANKKSTIEYYLTEIPNDALTINGLHEIWFDNNPLQKFPSLSNYTNTLHTLSLSNTLLTEIPNEINSLTSLKYLYLQNNKISEIKNLENLNNLLELNVANNLICGNFPEMLLTLTKLNYLNISYNKINSLPETLLNLIHLLILNIIGSDITEVSPNIPRRMTQLLIIGNPTSTNSNKETKKTNNNNNLQNNFGMNKNEEIELLNFLKNRAKSRNKINENNKQGK